MGDNEQTHMPNNAAAAWALVVGKAAISFIPFAGGPAAEVLAAIISPVIERRKTAWLESIAQGLHDLSKRVAELTPEQLAHDEAFATAFFHASLVAMRTHQREKLDALRNALLNVAVGTAPDESLQLMFLDALDALTPWHLILLDCVADPTGWAARHHYPLAPGWTPDAAVIFEAVFRDKMPAKGFHAQLLQDLYNRGLAANNINPRGQLFPHSEEDVIPHVTDLGRRFLSFVAAPDLPQQASTSDERLP